MAFFRYNSVLYVLLSTLTMQPPCFLGKQAIIQKYTAEKNMSVVMTAEK